MTGPEPDVLAIEDLRMLSAIAEGGLRGASTRLTVPRSTLSRRVVELEARLGDEIFLRRGRALVPTALGAVLISRASVALRALDEVELAARSAAAGRDRRLVVAASPLFAELVFGPVLEELARRRSDVTVELRLSHDYVEIFDAQVDVAVRRGPLRSADSTARRKLGRTTMLCVASPRVLDTCAPDDEAERRAETFAWIRVGARLEPFALTLARPGRRNRREVLLTPRYVVDSQRLAVDLAERGLGVVRVNAFFARDALARGTLVEVLPEARSAEDTFALFPRRPRMKPLVRDFLDVLVAQTARLAIWDR